VNEPGLNVMLIKIPNWIYLSEILLETDDYDKVDQDYCLKKVQDCRKADHDSYNCQGSRLELLEKRPRLPEPRPKYC